MRAKTLVAGKLLLQVVKHVGRGFNQRCQPRASGIAEAIVFVQELLGLLQNDMQRCDFGRDALEVVGRLLASLVYTPGEPGKGDDITRTGAKTHRSWTAWLLSSDVGSDRH